MRTTSWRMSPECSGLSIQITKKSAAPMPFVADKYRKVPCNAQHHAGTGRQKLLQQVAERFATDARRE